MDRTFTYEKHPETYKTGGLNLNEKDAGMVSVFTDILKKLGKKIMEGSFIDLLKMSRPARITSPLTQLISFSNDLKNTELMDLAALQKDPIERMKYLSGMHVNPIICKSKAPFNPILGETYQVEKPNGTKLYLEQTCHHPPTTHYCLVGPNNKYKIYGVNSVKGWREGKNFIVFDDGVKMNYSTPDLRVGGIIMGDREVGKIESVKNSITSITGMFKKKEEESTDHLSIIINQVNATTKERKVVCEGHGSWLGQIYIDSKKYWSYKDASLEWSQNGLFVLPSDSSYRKDMECVKNLDYEKAQELKDEYENNQRNDKKLREASKSK